jgi:hypothetical protein
MQRNMRGEFFVTYAGVNWTSVHDVEVDGQPVPDRESLRELFTREPDGPADDPCETPASTSAESRATSPS